MPYIKVSPKGDLTVEYEAGSKRLLETMQREVDGLIELVHQLHPVVAELVPDAVIVVNEEGVIRDLPFNPTATVMAHGICLFGNALLLKIAVVNEGGEQDIVPLTEEEARNFVRYMRRK